MRLILAAMILTGAILAIGTGYWYLEVYGPMGLEARTLDLEAQMQTILDRQEGPDAVTLSELLDRYR